MEKERKVAPINLILKLLYGSAIVIILFAVFNLFSYSSSKKVLEDPDYKSKLQDYAVFAMPTPDTLYFAGERVPLENFDVRESLDMEIHKVSYWHSEMFLYLKRANRFFPVIEPILKKNGVPEDFKYVCVAESGLRNAVSPAKAVGFWQFMASTAKGYGLTVNKEVDERYHLEKSTKAACKYLKKRYAKYGSWALVAASYNAGDGGVNKFMDYQNEDSYFDLALYEETSRYVYRALAMKLIMESPQNYGFNFRERDLYPVIDTKEVKVDSTITDLAAFAKKLGTNYKMLKHFNPWLRAHKLTNSSKKTYYITVPKKGARAKKYFPDEKEVIKSDNIEIKKDSAVINEIDDSKENKDSTPEK
jgi:membrane-bound lytic murein transglycosylase D